MAKAGDILRWSFQADIYRGQYRLIKHLGGGKWEIETIIERAIKRNIKDGAREELVRAF